MRMNVSVKIKKVWESAGGTPCVKVYIQRTEKTWPWSESIVTLGKEIICEQNESGLWSNTRVYECPFGFNDLVSNAWVVFSREKNLAPEKDEDIIKRLEARVEQLEAKLQEGKS